MGGREALDGSVILDEAPDAGRYGDASPGILTWSAGLADDGIEKVIVMIRYAFVLGAAGMLAAAAACGGNQEATPRTAAPTIAAPTTAAVTTPAAEPGEVVIERDLAYATWNDVTLTLDLYIPADPKGAPVMVEPWETFGDNIAQAGAFAVIERQGIPDEPDTEEPETDDDYPSIFRDHGALIRAQAEATACKIRYARARAAELGSDDPIVVLGGFSASVSPHVALFGDTLEQLWDEFAATVGGPPRQVDCVVAKGSTHVDALVVGNGTYDAYVPAIEGPFGRTYQRERDPELQAFLASAVGIDPSLTVRLMSATGDTVVPTSIAIAFEQVLADAGYDAQVITYDGVHTSSPPDELSLEVFSVLLGL